MEGVEWNEETSRQFYEDIRRVVKYDCIPWGGILAGEIATRDGAPRIAELGCGPGLLAREPVREIPGAFVVMMDSQKRFT